MKTQKITKKLTLHKQTLVNLDNSELDQAKGGTGTYYTVCATFVSFSCKCRIPAETCDNGC